MGTENYKRSPFCVKPVTRKKNVWRYILTIKLLSIPLPSKTQVTGHKNPDGHLKCKAKGMR